MAHLLYRKQHNLCIHGYVLILLFILSIISCATNPKLPNKTLAEEKSLDIYFIDVGQGDSILIRSPSGVIVLIDGGDTGRGHGDILPFLKSLNISSIDYIFASHFHSDHIGGLDEVVNGLGGSARIKIAAYDRGGNSTTTSFGEYISSIGEKRRSISPGQLFDLGNGLSLKCLAVSGSSESGRFFSGNDENALSIVLLLKYKSFELFLGGDSNTKSESVLGQLASDVDVYKVNHHGSSTSSIGSFLSTIKPEVSIISVGTNNTYGHPSPDTIARLLAIGSYIYQTEKGKSSPNTNFIEVSNGNIKLSTDGLFYHISGGDLRLQTRRVDQSDEPLGWPVIREARVHLLLPVPRAWVRGGSGEEAGILQGGKDND
jgi:competence protein ComEC